LIKWLSLEKIKEGLKLKNELANKVKIENAPDECLWNGSEDEFEEKSKTVGVLHLYADVRCRQQFHVLRRVVNLAG